MFANVDFSVDNFFRISNGIYMSQGIHNFINVDYDKGWEDHFYNDYIPAYGAVDSVEQFIAKFGNFIENSFNFYAVIFSAIHKNEQPEEGGWRWHKWGEYIGNQNPKCEYLYDEPSIDLVYTFRVLRKLNPVDINLLARVSEGRSKAFVLR